MIPVHVLGQQNTIFNRFMSELRDAVIQKDRLRFRRNLERAGEIMAYEISKTMTYVTKDVETPLGIAPCRVPSEEPVLACVLRAGLPLHKGLQNYFDHADNAFLSAFRKHTSPNTFDIEIEYLASPDLDNRLLILADPMLATGASMVLAHRAYLNRGAPSHTHLVAVIASTFGVDYVKKHMPANCTLWIGEIDDELTAQGYIVPGLGDAGDLAFGEKL
ncbi:MAG: uracil phosphoribosyltransferase [Flavobacteriales bacterium]